MNPQKIQRDKQKSREYNNEPFYYCKNCLSLDIRILNGVDYCNCCGSTSSITEGNDINDWLDAYNKMYPEPNPKKRKYYYTNRRKTRFYNHKK